MTRRHPAGLATIFALGVLGVLGTVLATPARAQSWQRAHYQLHAQGGDLVLADGKGRPLAVIGDLHVGWGAPQLFRPTQVRAIADGRLQVDYVVKNDTAANAAFSAEYELGDAVIRAEYRLRLPPAVKAGGAMLQFSPAEGAEHRKVLKAGRWQHAASAGGSDFEIYDGYFRVIAGGDSCALMAIHGNALWRNDRRQHLTFTPEGEPGNYCGRAEYVVAPTAMPALAPAVLNNRPYAIVLSTPRPFNCFAPADGLAPFDVTVGATHAGTATLAVQVRDFDGRVVLQEQRDLTFAERAIRREAFVLPIAEVQRGIFFVSASIRDQDRELVFARTTIAVLPPHDFSGDERSIFGIAAFFNEPSRSAALAMLKRLGVRYVRQGDNRHAPDGITFFGHTSLRPDSKPENMDAAIQKLAAAVIERQNPVYEFCNEWNMAALNKAPEEATKMRRERAELYTEALKRLRAIRAAAGADFKIVSVGIAGADLDFLRALHDAGALALLDGIALHPGRGNVTADAAFGFWNYFGSVRVFQDAIRELCPPGAPLPLYLTEVYACTHANNWWKDSCRAAAENTVISYALAMAAGARQTFFYQFNDGTHFDIGGVRENDSEYSYGLVRRDGSLKAAALAYAAIAEALDQAEFSSYHRPGGDDESVNPPAAPDSNLHVVRFATPRGPLAILWDRSEGYVQSQRDDALHHREAWVPHWTKSTTVTLPCAGDNATVIDVIGRSRRVSAVNGAITIAISGEPVMIYGLDENTAAAP